MIDIYYDMKNFFCLNIIFLTSKNTNIYTLMFIKWDIS